MKSIFKRTSAISHVNPSDVWFIYDHCLCISRLFWMLTGYSSFIHRCEHLSGSLFERPPACCSKTYLRSAEMASNSHCELWRHYLTWIGKGWLQLERNGDYVQQVVSYSNFGSEYIFPVIRMFYFDYSLLKIVLCCFNFNDNFWCDF